jgi:hypothetical protein
MYFVFSILLPSNGTIFYFLRRDSVSPLLGNKIVNKNTQKIKTHIDFMIFDSNFLYITNVER